MNGVQKSFFAYSRPARSHKLQRPSTISYASQSCLSCRVKLSLPAYNQRIASLQRDFGYSLGRCKCSLASLSPHFLSEREKKADYANRNISSTSRAQDSCLDATRPSVSLEMSTCRGVTVARREAEGGLA